MALEIQGTCFSSWNFDFVHLLNAWQILEIYIEKGMHEVCINNS